MGTISNLLRKMMLIRKHINTTVWYITISHLQLVDSATRNKQEWIQKTFRYLIKPNYVPLDESRHKLNFRNTKLYQNVKQLAYSTHINTLPCYAHIVSLPSFKQRMCCNNYIITRNSYLHGYPRVWGGLKGPLHMWGGRGLAAPSWCIVEKLQP